MNTVYDLLTGVATSAWSWVCVALRWIGFPLTMEAKILLLGLDNAGKTTLLHLLRYGSIKQAIPTRNPTMEQLVLNNVVFSAYDMGGNIRERPLWPEYFPTVSGLVFIIDVADTARLAEARDVLNVTLQHESLRNTPVLILGNKIDLPTAISESQLGEFLLISSSSPLVRIQMCSIVKKQGFRDGFEWLARTIQEKSSS